MLYIVEGTQHCLTAQYFANNPMKNCVITEWQKANHEGLKNIGKYRPSLMFLPVQWQTIHTVVIKDSLMSLIDRSDDLAPPGKTFILHLSLLPTSDPTFFF